MNRVKIRVGMRAAAFPLFGVALLAGAPASAASRWGADYFPNVPLLTQDGTTVHFYDDLLKGKSVAINVIYTHCKDECPLETARLVQTQRLLGERMGKDIFFYSISIDPEHDTPAVLRAYATKFAVGPGWLFLTGKAQDVALVVRKLGLSRASDPVNPDGHAASLMVGNEPTGRWMRNSAEDNPKFLAATIGKFLGFSEAMPQTSYTEARPLKMGQGEYIFTTRCATCHSVGEGARLGPDLAGVTERRPRAWLARYLLEPDKLRDEGDPTATGLFRKYNSVVMPNLGLGMADVAAVLSYLEGRRGAS